MDWSNEDYVRMYTRETSDDLMLSWEALALWRAMLCKFDRAGLIDTKRGPRGLAALVRMPLEVVERAVLELLSDGRVRSIETGYFSPNFMDAQNASKSDKQRQKESREARASRARSQPDSNRHNNHVTNRDDLSQVVTGGHNQSQVVTLCSADPLLDPLLDPEREALPRQPSTGYPTRHGMGPSGEPHAAAPPVEPDPVSEPKTPQPDAAMGSTSRRKRSEQLTDAWEPSCSKPNKAAEAEARARGVDPVLELEKLRDWARSKGESRRDWDAQWRNWLRGARRTPGGVNGYGQQAVLSNLLADIAEAERRGES